MPSKKSLWFRLGYALERARSPAPTAGQRLEGLAKRVRGSAVRRPKDEDGAGGSADELLTAGLVLVAGKLLDAWRPRRGVRFSGLLRAAAAGAGAALALDLVKPLLRGRPELGALDRSTVDHVLAGLGEGLVYGAVVEPRLPGSALLKGAVFGSVEYAADAAGGLTHLVGAHTPYARLPMVGRLLEDLDPHERDYVEHLVFGIIVGLLYGASPSSNGTRVGEDDEG
jgi:hypothetical protein